MFKYYYFLKDIINDEIEAASILSKITNVDKARYLEKHTLNCWEGNIGLIKASGDIKSLGRINTANLQASKLIGYAKKELMGMKCNRFMISLLAEIHDNWILDYYETMRSKMLGSITTMFLKNKDGFCELFELYISPIPGITKGMQEFAVFFKKTINNPHIPHHLLSNKIKPAVMFCDDKLNILGFNSACSEYFGIPLEIVDISKTNCNLHTIFPFLKELKKITNGICIDIDLL